AERPVEIYRLEYVAMPDADHTLLAAECGKGTYVRSLARDMGRAMGCLGHVSALRRTSVGPFAEGDCVDVDRLQSAASAPDNLQEALTGLLQPVAAALKSLPLLNVGQSDGARLARGQTVLLRGRDAPIMQGLVVISTQGSLVALAEVTAGELHPRRIFNLSGPMAAVRP